MDIFGYHRILSYIYVVRLPKRQEFKQKIKVMKLIRRFTCGLTGDDCVIIDYGDGVEICELYSTYLDLK